MEGPAPDSEGERADALLDLGDRIAELARSIQVAEAEMMQLIVEFDDRRGWEEAGFGSCAEWLAWRIGVRPNAARERVRTARALTRLPQASAAMAAGELPYAKARALTRVATPESEEALLELAGAGSAENLERVVRAWKAMDDEQELTFEQARHRRRRFSVVVADDGAYVVRGRLDPEAGAMLMRAVEAASDALYREERKAAGGRPAGEARSAAAARPAPNARPDPDDGAEGRSTVSEVSAAYAGESVEGSGGGLTPAQRRADAVGLLAERALAAGFGESGEVNSTRAERYQVLLHVEADTLVEGRESGRSELDGVRISKQAARRLTCDAAVSVVEHACDEGGDDRHDDGDDDRYDDSDDAGHGSGHEHTSMSAPGVTAVTSEGGELDGGSAGDSAQMSRPTASLRARLGVSCSRVLGVGRRTRTVPPALRRALLARDRGCRFPGCGSRFVEAHHIVHWADGGRTDLDNLVLLCLRHHHAVHERGMSICMDREASVVFFTAKGRAVGATPRPIPGSMPAPPASPLPPAPPSEAAYPGAARWRRDRDVPWALEARAWEAMDSGSSGPHPSGST